MRINSVAAISAAFLCFASFGITAAQSQSYPDHQIKLVVPFPAGGPTDVIGRQVAEILSDKLGQTVIVDNRPGAGGSIGAKAVAESPPDGYTLLMGSTSTLAMGPALRRYFGYNPTKAFKPVAFVSNVPFVLVVNPTVPVKSVQDLVAYAKKNPEKLNFSSAGNGTPPHLIGEMFKAASGADIAHIPYKGGAPSITDLLGGQVQMTFETASVLLPLIKDGKLRALAVTSPTRLPSLPDVPTMIESGFPGFLASSWTGVVAPAGVPPDAIAKLNAAVNEGLRSSATKDGFARLGVEAKPGSPQDLASHIQSELERWSGVVQRSKIGAPDAAPAGAGGKPSN